MNDQIIKTNGVYFSYPGSQNTINGITFNVTKGESVGIIGPNGAGKSTLLMLLMGILNPEKGEVKVDDIIVSKKTLSIIRKSQGMVFQNPDDQLFMTTVYDDVAFGPRNLKMNEEEVDLRVNQALEKTGIIHLKNRPPFKLSAGEKKAAAIASILSMDPDILILDEPTASLDPRSRRRLIELLKSFDHTKIITSHDLDMVCEVCSRVIIIKDGRILSEGLSKNILSDKSLMEKSGLEIPLSMQNCIICGNIK
jgi:cobalt/nickel transport system ATP-binding protein